MTGPAAYDVPHRTEARRVCPADRVVTIVLMAGLALLVPVAGMVGLLTAMSSDGCTASECNDALLGLGVMVSAAAFAVVAAAALVRVVVRWRSDRSTWWVPLVAAGAGAALWVLGAAMTASAVG